MFPSTAPEAGPLVFLEALASGCFPVSTATAGVFERTPDDAATRALREAVTVDPAAESLVRAVAAKCVAALTDDGARRDALRALAAPYDWSNVARDFAAVLEDLAD